MRTKFLDMACDTRGEILSVQNRVLFIYPVGDAHVLDMSVPGGEARVSKPRKAHMVGSLPTGGSTRPKCRSSQPLVLFLFLPLPGLELL